MESNYIYIFFYSVSKIKQILSPKAYEIIRNNFEKKIAAISEKPVLKDDIDKVFYLMIMH